jgi:hypothetical protein
MSAIVVYRVSIASASIGRNGPGGKPNDGIPQSALFNRWLAAECSKKVDFEHL